MIILLADLFILPLCSSSHQSVSSSNVEGSALSNCVCADNDFTINHKEIKIDKQPYVILSATDGCFGYCRTPMHFEHLLASSLFSSNNQEDWERRMKEQIQEISGDDFSIAIIAKGFKDFSELKRLLGKKSTQYVEEM